MDDDLLEIPDFLIRTVGDTTAPRRFSDEVTERRRTKSIVRCCAKLLQKHRKHRKHRKRRVRKRRRASQ